MIKALEKLEERVKQKLPTRTVLLVPGEYFFSKSLDLPEGINEEDIARFAEFSLEDLSPFSIAQLGWGYLHKPGSTKILLYAAYLERLRRAGYDDLDKFHHVYPSFITVLNRSATTPTAVSVAHGTTLSIVTLEAGCPVPNGIHSISLGVENADGEALKSGHVALIDSIDTSHYEVEKQIWLTEELRVESDGSIDCHGKEVRFDSESEPYSESLNIGESLLWDADIRSGAFITKERKEEGLTQKLWKATVVAGIAAALLLFLQIGYFATGIWIKTKERTVENQTTDVLMIEERDNLLQRIEQFAQQELKLFEILETMNIERPSDVYFTKAHADSFNELRIEGIGSNVETVNRYTDRLNQSPKIASVRTRVASRQGKAPFTLTVTFQDAEIESSEVLARVESDQ